MGHKLEICDNYNENICQIHFKVFYPILNSFKIGLVTLTKTVLVIKIV